MTSPSLTIIIPTWNRKELLAECLDSLNVQTYTDLAILVVDDGSTDGTTAFVHERYPDVEVLSLVENGGFCKAVNAGLRACSTELIMLLNNDMTFEPDCVEKMVQAMDTQNAAMVAPLVLWKDEPDRIYSIGDRQLTNGRPESIGFREPLEGFSFPTTVFGVSAGAAVYRREVFDKVGLLDERFIAYFEDSDLNFRARLAGFKAIAEPAARAYHVGSASIEGRTWWRARQCYRNHALLVLKSMPASLLLRYDLAILTEHIHQTRRLISSARCAFGLPRALWEWAKALVDLASLLPHALGERRRIRQLRALKPSELAELLERPRRHRHPGGRPRAGV